MLIALLAAGVLTVTPSSSPTQLDNAMPLRLKGRTVALTAAQLGRTCVSCRLVSRVSVAQKSAEPTPPPLVVPHDDGVTPPPLLDSDESAPPRDELTPPPDAPSWQVPPNRKLVPPPQNLNYDRNAGEWVGKEVAAGTLVLLVSDLVVGGAIFAIIAATFASSFRTGGSDFVLGIFFAVALSLAHAALSPLWAAIAVKAIADEPTSNGFGGAALGAYVSAVGLAAVTFGVLIAISLVESASGVATGSSFASSFGSLFLLVGVVARWIGVPMAASWAMHRGPKASVYAAATAHPRKPVLINAFGREERPVGGATVFAF